jgi:hypothetical protein
MEAVRIAEVNTMAEAFAIAEDFTADLAGKRSG